MGQAISESSHARQQSFSLCEIHWQHSQMVSDSFELRLAGSIRSEKQFLEHNWVYGETNAAFGLSGEQLSCRRLSPKVSHNYVRVQEHERPLPIGTFA